MIIKEIKKLVATLRMSFRIARDGKFAEVRAITLKEKEKTPNRTHIINFLLSLTERLDYLEIGVRNPQSNFAHIKCRNKISVDPGVEFKENPVSYKMTSDAFFNNLDGHKLQIKPGIRFDVVFIDGLHLAEQVERDILNSLRYIKDDGFIVLHDCNPPTIFHQREDYGFLNSPAKGSWNGTTWKAFYKYRHSTDLYSICFDTDWGVGILSKTPYGGFNQLKQEIWNPYFEYMKLQQKKGELLNLMDFEVWRNKYPITPRTQNPNSKNMKQPTCYAEPVEARNP